MAADTERFFIDSDDDGHWYVVPLAQRAAWEKWCALPSTDEEAWEVPGFAERLDGGPNGITFAAWKRD
jgi:hypothetical protein